MISTGAGRRYALRGRPSLQGPVPSVGGREVRYLSSPVVTRRMAVLSVGVVLLVVFGVLGAAVPVPYVAQVPGPTFNTLGEMDGEPIISVEGHERNETEGELTLTTVGVSRAGLSLVEAVQGTA